MMKRRDALKAIGGLGAAAGMARLLPGCGGSDDGPVGITTYVYLMMENRSYDHFFGGRKLVEQLPGDGLTADMRNPDRDGTMVGPWTPDDAHRETLCDLDPPHGWDAAHAQWNAGKNDGFLREHQGDYDSTSAIQPMQYLSRNHVPVSWTLADAYASSDRWFCSVMGPTWPNRFYWHSGQSGGLMANIIPKEGLNWPTIYHRLDAKGVDWRYYYATLPVVPLFDGINTAKIHQFNQFLLDARDGVLPPVVYIDPAFNDNDDHPPVHPINGQQLIATVYTALAQSPQWKNCLLVVTYDENGGFFDHVSPPKTVDDRAAQGFDQLGFRVPTMVIGPYVKQGHVSSVTYDHCSALRELEVAFDLEPLNQRTAAANDLSDFLDADRLARGDWRAPIALPDVTPSEWPMPELCFTGTLRQASHPVLEAAETHPERFVGFDHRAELPEYRRAIREFLTRRAGLPSLARDPRASGT